MGAAQLIFTERTYEGRSKLLGFLMRLLGLEVTRRPSAAVFVRMKVAAAIANARLPAKAKTREYRRNPDTELFERPQ